MHVEVAVHELIRCRCTRINDPWRRFCGGCGSALEPCCDRCGFVNARTDRFCGGCGAVVAGSELAAGTVRGKLPVRPASPASSVAPRASAGSDRQQTMPLEILDEIQ